MKENRFYVIGGQYQAFNHGGTPTLLGAKRLAKKCEEYWDNWQGFHVPSIYAAKGLLPDALKEASSLAKMLGDTAAHDKELEIDQYDVEAMAEFIGFIIEYLYVVPDKISAYKVRLDAKTTSKNNT